MQHVQIMQKQCIAALLQADKAEELQSFASLQKTSNKTSFYFLRRNC